MCIIGEFLFLFRQNYYLGLSVASSASAAETVQTSNLIEIFKFKS